MKELRNMLFQIMHQNILDYENHYHNVFMQFLLFLKSRKYQITEEVKQEVRKILNENERFIKSLLNGLTLQITTFPKIKPNVPKEVREKLWNYKYPDGLTLSERIWKNKKEAEKEFYQILRKQTTLAKSFVDTAYKIQYHMEKLHKQKYVNLTNENIKLIEKLRATAKAMIKGKITKEKFNKVLKQYEKYISRLKESPYGMKTAHQDLLKKLTKAVEDLSEEGKRSFTG